MAMPLWVVRIIKATFPGLFAIARSTRWPVIGRAVDKALFDGDRMVYLARDNTIRIDRSVNGEETVLPSSVVEHFIDRANAHFVMNECICRDSNKCEDYPRELGCLFMGASAERINPALGRLVTKEEAKEHLARCREAGLVHVIGRNKLDAVWLNAWPKERLLTVCNCCPCCCLWRTIPVLSEEIGEKVTGLPGVRAVVGEDCTGCGECEEGVCFVDAIRIEDDRAVIGESCRACGRCVEACPAGAIKLAYQEESVREAIEAIAREVDLD